MNINYTFLYLSEGKKLIFSEENPSFNKDLKDTADRKAVLYLPAKDMVSRIIKEFSVTVTKSTHTRLDRELYFGPFIKQELSVMTSYLTNFFHVQKEKVVFNSNIDYNLRELMQEFSKSTNVYFGGWEEYYLCSLDNFKQYVMDKSLRVIPVVPTVNSLKESDPHLKMNMDLYEISKSYADFMWWFPLWKEDREKKVLSEKKVIDDYVNEKITEAERKKQEYLQYEAELLLILEDIEKNLQDLPKDATEISLLLNLKKN